jgi:hypothetical protein
MERRYYLLKTTVVLFAVATVTLTSGMGSTRIAHEVNFARYSAPAQIEAAAWHTTAWIARAAASLLGIDSSAGL